MSNSGQFRLTTKFAPSPLDGPATAGSFNHILRMLLVLALLAGAGGYGLVTAGPAVAAAPLTCSGSTIYTQNGGTIYALNTTTGVTSAAVVTTAVGGNSLGIAPGGTTAYWKSTIGGIDYIIEYDLASAAFTQTAIPALHT